MQRQEAAFLELRGANEQAISGHILEMEVPRLRDAHASDSEEPKEGLIRLGTERAYRAKTAGSPQQLLEFFLRKDIRGRPLAAAPEHVGGRHFVSGVLGMHEAGKPSHCLESIGPLGF
jgi:hypothetical protein